MVDIINWAISSYSTIGFVVFLNCILHDDRELFESVLLGIFWPVYVIKFIVKFIKENT